MKPEDFIEMTYFKLRMVFELARLPELMVIPMLVSLALLPGCGRSEQQPPQNNQQRMKEALSNLINRTNTGAFVIFTEPVSGKFVQFATSPVKGIQLDLPNQTLDSAELERAKSMFGMLGEESRTWQLYDRPGGTPQGNQSGFQMSLGRDLDWAVSIANRVFIEVYRSKPDHQLTIQQN